MKYWAESFYQGVEPIKIGLLYWWPGKQFGDEERLPPKFRKLVKQCKRSRSRYMAFAYTKEDDEEGSVYAYSRCMEIDRPSKKYARDRALGLLRQALLHEGYVIVKR